MKQKRVAILLVSVYFFIICLHLLAAQNAPPSTPQPSSPLLGEINPQTGQPKNLETLQKYGDYYRQQEQNKSFLQQEWGILLAKNKFIAPVLFYTDKFFSFFNPLWNIVLGMEFSWSFAFFIGLGLWGIIIFFVYFPAEQMLDNKLFGLITGFIVATITGTFGIINKAMLFAVPFIQNIWHLAFLIILAILLATLYTKMIVHFKKESDEDELKKARENIKSHGKISKKTLQNSSARGGI